MRATFEFYVSKRKEKPTTPRRDIWVGKLRVETRGKLKIWGGPLAIRLCHSLSLSLALFTTKLNVH